MYEKFPLGTGWVSVIRNQIPWPPSPFQDSVFRTNKDLGAPRDLPVLANPCSLQTCRSQPLPFLAKVKHYIPSLMAEPGFCSNRCPGSALTRYRGAPSLSAGASEPRLRSQLPSFQPGDSGLTPHPKPLFSKGGQEYLLIGLWWRLHGVTNNGPRAVFRGRGSPLAKMTLPLLSCLDSAGLEQV